MNKTIKKYENLKNMEHMSIRINLIKLLRDKNDSSQKMSNLILLATSTLYRLFMLQVVIGCLYKMLHLLKSTLLFHNIYFQMTTEEFINACEI